jgi:hypothetical protein
MPPKIEIGSRRIMDDHTRETLMALVRAYQRRVATAAELLRSRLKVRSLMLWREAHIPQRGEAGGFRYYFHGIGVAIHLPDGIIDFDFGHDGRTDGFSTWKLAAFAEQLNVTSHDFTKWQHVQRLLGEGLREGWLHQPLVALQDDLYYMVTRVAA